MSAPSAVMPLIVGPVQRIGGKPVSNPGKSLKDFDAKVSGYIYSKTDVFKYEYIPKDGEFEFGRISNENYYGNNLQILIRQINLSNYSMCSPFFCTWQIQKLEIEGELHEKNK
jgi:hypothetical protein